MSINTTTTTTTTTTTSTEGWHTVADGTQLYTKTWKPATSTPVKARVLFVHGFSDHCNNYEYLFVKFAENGIETYSFDQRGWGRSVKKPSERGLTGPTTTVMADITSMLESVIPSPVPLFLMGHSMGGAEILVYAAQGPAKILSNIRGFISSAPLIALHPHTRPWRFTVVLGRLAGRLLPRRQMVNKLDSAALTHDEKQNKLYEEDTLCHDTGTLEGLAGMLDRAEALDTGKIVLHDGVGEGGVTRLLLVHGTEDRVNDFAASKAFVERCDIKDKTLKPYEGLFHNMHAEAGNDKTIFAEDISKWILGRSDPAPAQARL
ncbi:hypothetical protein AAFC00_001369 [Neodothiora populina]|uniref:Serine aminopeptidase S33 domain-containing protein n=1 Tax=Neodothiora populina TaxID=2781224 RepID=A0ABR3PNV7_9PEZI